MAYGAGAAGAAGAGYMYQICDKLTEAVVTFVNSIHFNKEEVKEETKRSQLNLTQAYAPVSYTHLTLPTNREV